MWRRGSCSRRPASWPAITPLPPPSAHAAGASTRPSCPTRGAATASGPGARALRARSSTRRRPAAGSRSSGPRCSARRRARTLLPTCARALRRGLLLRQLDEVTGPLALGLQVSDVVRIGLRQGSNPPVDDHALGFQRGDLRWIVRDQVDRASAELLQHLRGDVVATQIVAEPERAVRLARIGPPRLQGVSPDLVPEADAAALLAQVDHRAPLGAADQIEGVLELLAAIAFQRSEDLAGEAFAVDADGHAFLTPQLAFDSHDVLLVRAPLPEDDRAQKTASRRQRSLRIQFDEIGGPGNGVQVSGRQGASSCTPLDAPSQPKFLFRSKRSKAGAFCPLAHRNATRSAPCIRSRPSSPSPLPTAGRTGSGEWRFPIAKHGRPTARRSPRPSRISSSLPGPSSMRKRARPRPGWRKHSAKTSSTATRATRSRP